MRILHATWNVNVSEPGVESLNNLLVGKEHQNRNLPPQIVAISLQEMIDLKSFKSYYKDSEEEHFVAIKWAKVIQNTLLDVYQTSFAILETVSLVGVSLIVLVNCDVRSSVRHVKIASIPTGSFGLGNKGACALSMTIKDSNHRALTCCFISSHFAAHQNEVLNRNLNFFAICSGISFTSSSTSYRQQSTRKISVDSEDAQISSILDHDFISWAGDLNYRIDNLTRDDVIAFVSLRSDRNFDALLQHDQLLAEKAKDRVFPGFSEAKILFPPTYKYQPKTNFYETRLDKKVRVPSYTDRILYRCTQKNLTVLPILYDSDMTVSGSDHKPVTLIIEIPEFTMAFSRRSNDFGDQSGVGISILLEQTAAAQSASSSILNNSNISQNSPVKQLQAQISFEDSPGSDTASNIRKKRSSLKLNSGFGSTLISTIHGSSNNNTSGIGSDNDEDDFHSEKQKSKKVLG